MISFAKLRKFAFLKGKVTNILLSTTLSVFLLHEIIKKFACFAAFRTCFYDVMQWLSESSERKWLLTQVWIGQRTLPEKRLSKGVSLVGRARKCETRHLRSRGYLLLLLLYLGLLQRRIFLLIKLVGIIIIFLRIINNLWKLKFINFLFTIIINCIQLLCGSA